MLDKDMIREPQLWQLVLEVSASGLHVMAYTPLEEFSLISEFLPYDPAAVSPLRALEDVVYENPLLTQGFSRVTVLYDTQRFLLLPGFVDTAPEAEALLRLSLPPGDGGGNSEIIVNDLPSLDSRLAFEVDSDTLGFLRRTFFNATLLHPLVPTSLYFKSKYPLRARGKMFVNLRGGKTDLLVLGDGAPLLLNSFGVREPIDSVYFCLNARQSLCLAHTDEIIIAGPNSERMAVTALLRRYVRYVMPAIFPSTMFRAGRAALSTPFEIIVTPLIQ